MDAAPDCIRNPVVANDGVTRRPVEFLTVARSERCLAVVQRIHVGVLQFELSIFFLVQDVRPHTESLANLPVPSIVPS